MPLKFLVIQTAFIGDVVLATGIIESLHHSFPDAEIDFMVRKGNEGLLTGHPYVKKLWVWNKQEAKLLNLFKLLFAIRKRKYDKAINVQRYAATGLLTGFSGAKEKIGFDKNPFSFLFTKKVAHDFDPAKHEMERNFDLIRHFAKVESGKPRLYPSPADNLIVEQYKRTRYLCVSPASVWYTKQYPADKWVSFINTLPLDYTIYLLGGPADIELGDEIKKITAHPFVVNLCGQFNFLKSAALMKDAVMNYTNDSAPLHFASAVNASVTVVYCSTVPAFGYGPLSDKSFIVERNEPLYCRPCGIHGLRACPEGHFKCARDIRDEQLMESLKI
jgi:ADP-heptose:LPS heptosyltransferase